MRTLFTMAEELPALDAPLKVPGLGWREALAQGQHLMQEAASQHRFTIVQEQGLWLDRERGGKQAYRARARALMEWTPPSTLMAS
jgi:hypothetical protein